jgi:alginate O-acetyltransferase complex protein AlgI
VIAGLFVGHVVVGLALRSLRPAALAALLAWAWLVLSTVLLLAALADAPAGARFVALCAGCFVALKAVVHASARTAGEPALSVAAWLGWSLLAVGMVPRAFARFPGPALPGAGRRIARGLLGTVACGALWWALACARRADAPAFALGLGQLVGAYLLLRFGLFPLGAGVLAALGVEAGPVFRAPERARSLTEFWSRRWNRPFSEMLQIAVARPVLRRAGPTAALAASFLVSALLHEVALSAPVRAGYGLPTAYFALHFGLLAAEARWRARGRGPEAWGVGGRAWTLGWAALPAVLVFHPPFVAGVLLPLLGPRG